MTNQPLDENQLKALLRLKRFEQPPPGYFDDLLNRVHRRQREELLRRPAWQIALERVRAFFSPLRLDWAHAAKLAALLVVGVGVIRIALPQRGGDGAQFTGNAVAAVGPRAKPTARPERVVTLQPHNSPILAVDSEKRFARNNAQPGSEVPTRFVIDTQPVSYEATPIRF
jgi:hypothetical protein